MNRPPRVLIAYGYAPSGHSAGAFALAEACRERGLDARLISIAGEHHPWAGLAVARGYHGLLRASPGAWGALYGGAWARRALRAVRSAYLSLGGAQRLLEGVRGAGADVVVCPQAAVSAVLAEARRRGELRVPVVGVLTDYSVHPFWSDPSPDLLIEEIPVHPAFARRPGRAEARRSLDLPSSAPVLLLSGGGKGLGGVEEAAAALLDRAPRAYVLALAGSNERLRSRLSGRPESGSRLRVFGPQPPEFVSRLIAAADLHVGKPGGMTAAESMSCGLPMILLPAFPGQESANASRLVAAGAALSPATIHDAASVAAALLADADSLRTLAERAAELGRPDAAAAAARRLAAFLAHGGASAGIHAAPRAY